MTSAFAQPTEPNAARSRWIPWAFVVGMLTVVGANATLIYFAVQSWGGLVTDRAFERGIAYNRLIAAAAAEEALGWKADIALENAAKGQGPALVVALRKADETPMTRAVVAVEAQRPLEAQKPVIISMRYIGDGRYAGAAEALRPGQWDIRVTVANEGTAAHFTRRVYVR